MRNVLLPAPLGLVAALAAGLPTLCFADDRHRDARSRHDRASSSSSSSSSSVELGGWSEEDDPCPDPNLIPTWAPGVAVAGAAAEGDPGEPVVLGGEFWVETFFTPGRLGGLGGATLREQQGWGGDLGFGATIFDDEAGKGGFGLTLLLDIGFARVLDDQPIYDPEADTPYSSNLDLLAVEAELGPTFWRRFEHVEVVLGFGLGVGAIRAYEEFSDGLALDELLALGLRLRPYARIETRRRAAWGVLSAEVGAAVFAGRVTEHVADYDSLVSGLAELNLTPRARIGYLFKVSPSTGVGATWEGELFGLLQRRRAFAQRVLFTLRYDFGAPSETKSSTVESSPNEER
jgi:hypothetical protein